ncbi:MAG: 3'-5' exonuclease domain-containing protein 2 [Prevotellaceae bacterium]|jgi:ribonuclease D|nr:3'-5' exonuclease domain-containing protein 2 [Prevotellaceae bacterium]
MLNFIKRTKEPSFVITKTIDTNLPLAYFEGKITVVDNDKQVQKAIHYLNTQKTIGFDTETKPLFIPGKRNGNPVALLQLSTDKRAYLFRLNKLGMPAALRELMSNKHILKIGAAIHEDLRQLQALSPFKAAGFVDIQRIVQHYGIEDKGVKKLAAIVLQIHISKNQQLSNWENPVLTKSQCRYAATDAWVCREIFLRLQKIKNLTPAELQLR